MTTIKRFLTLFLLITLSLSYTYATDDVSTITSKAWAGLSSHWSASGDAFGYDGTKGAQLNGTAQTLTATDFTNVTSVSISCSKASSATGTITITAGSNTKSITSFSTSPTSETLSIATPYTGTITISISPSNKSLYIKSITVTYSGGGGTYTVTLNKNGVTSTISDLSSAYTLPTTGEHVADACDDWKFHCWANASYSENTTAPSSSVITSMTSTGTAYAVYKHSTGGGEVTFNVKSIADSKGWSSGTQYSSYEIDPYTVTYSGGANDGKYYSSDDSWRLYKNGTITITSSSGDISEVETSPSLTFSISGNTATYTEPSDGSTRNITEIIVRSGTTTYTSSPACGPKVQATASPWVTSTKDDSVKVEVPVTATHFDAGCTLNATLSAASLSAGFKILGWGGGGNTVTAGDDLETTLIIQYKPGAYGTTTIPTADATITFSSTGYSGSGTPEYVNGIVHGRSLPQKFLIIAKNDNKWWAVPANMPTSASTFAGVEVTPDNTTTPTTVPAGPATALYSLTGVHADNYAADGQYVRFFSAQTNRMLWASTSGTGIKNDALYTGTSKSNSYEWKATTTNGQVYTLTNVGNENPDYALKYNDGQDRFGYYELGNASLYIVPVGCANRAALTSKDSTYNSITLAWDGAEGQSYNVYVQYSGSTEKSALLATSPCTISGLAHDDSEYTYIITPGAIDDPCKLEGTIHTKVAPINITLSCDGTEYDLGPQDNPYTLPTTGEYVADPCDGWEFVGWSATEVAANSTSYTSATQATATGTYYAVYAKGGSGNYESYSGVLTEGDYVIYYDGYSLANTISSSRFTNGSSDPDEGVIVNPDESEIWHIAPSGDYWTIYNAAVEKYAGGTTTKNQGALLASVTNYAKWTCSSTAESTTYNFINKGREEGGSDTGNKYLRNNTTNGWACYGTGTGGALSLYKINSSYSSTSDCCPEVEVPNVSVATRTTSATISWDKQVAATNGYNVTITSKSVNEDLPTNTTSYVVEDLQEATEYAYTITAKGPTCTRSFSGVFATDTLSISIAEWDTCGVYLDLGDMNGATAILENQNTQATISVNYADSLFFSKYFEADSENKLLAIYNGTKDTINLSNYCLKRSELNQSEKTMELGTYGRIKSGYICPNEEIILIRYANKDENSAEECASSQEGYDNWYIFGNGAEGTFLNFSGPMSVGLYSKRASKFIDVIGASTNASGTGSLCQINASNNVTCSEATRDFNDMAGFYTLSGDNQTTETVETDYGLSTNRCLLIRKNTVKSGMDAVAGNVYATQQDCSSDIAEAFTTLSSEWAGLQIGSGTSSGSTHSKTCEGMGYVGGFNYNQYYSKFDTIPYTEDFMHNRQEDGTYFVHIPGLSEMSCTNLRISVVDTISKSPLELKKVTGTWKVPIMVWKDTATTSTLFTKEADDCAECDVVVMRKANLNVVAGGKNTIRDIEVYHSGQLNIPSTQTFNVRRLVMRSKEDTVPRADIQGALSQSQTTFAFDKRMKAGRWYKIALPYRCKISEVTYRNGELAHYGKDWYLQTYDGNNRANGIQTGNWHMYSGEYMEPGVGYNLAIDGDILEPGNSYAEFRFPMTANTNFAENATVPVGVNAWGAGDTHRQKDGKDVTPNHLGWNMIGNPYMLDYTTGSITTPLTIGELQPDGITWKLNKNGTRYVVALKNTREAYEQIAIGAAGKEMEPFIAYFVQIDGTSDGQALNITFAKGQQKGRSSIVRRNKEEYDEEDTTPIWCGINITNDLGEKDETALLMSNDFTNDYDMMNDFGKWTGDKYKEYTKPMLASRNTTGEMAFNALPDSTAAIGAPLTLYAGKAGQYTFRLDEVTYGMDPKIKKVEVYDADNEQWHSLMNGHSYSFYTVKGQNTERFKIRVIVERETPQVPTDIEQGSDWYGEAPCKVLFNGHVYIIRGGKVYDITGKQVR